MEETSSGKCYMADSVQIKSDRNLYRRRSMRLKGHDYAQAGAYFITICTRGRHCLFGQVVNSEMYLNEYERIVEREWLRNATIRPSVILDEFVIMPNHFHGIVVLTDARATHRVAPTERPNGPTPSSIGAIIGQFKSIVTKGINVVRGTRGVLVWQRNYYEHVIRSEWDINRAREYIVNNPAHWAEDEYNPKHWQKVPGRRWIR